MSATSKRRRRKTQPGPTTAPEAAAAPAIRGLAQWHWRTFPVYFALALGLFVGMYAGIVAAAIGSAAMIVVSLVIAIMLGLGLSRLTTRWMMQRNWIKPRARR